MEFKKISQGLIIFLSLFHGIIYSQNINVSGIVKGSDNSNLANTNVSFLDIESEKNYEKLTDEKGNFNLKLPIGSYMFTIDREGYESYFDQIYLEKDTLLDNLVLLSNTEEVNKIESIVITATPPPYKVSLDKKIYDVTQDITAKGGTLSDVMQNVPSVSVDVDGTVNLRGNDNVKILIDGKPSSMLGITNTGDALKMISADMVEKIEVITNASARYEAAGTAGIINIVTKKNKKKGITGSIDLIAGTPQLYGTNLSLGYGKNNWKWFANAGLRYSKSKGKNNTLYRQFNDDGTENSFSLQDGSREQERTSFNASTGFTVDIDKDNSLTTSVGYRTNKTNGLNITNYNDIFPLARYSERKERQHNNGYGIDGNVNFTHNFEKKGNTLTLDGNFTYTTDDSHSDIFDENFQKNYNNNSRTGFMIKSDYILPFKEDSQFEAGMRANFSKLKTDFALFDYDVISNDWINNPDFTDKTDYEENIFSAYAQYGNKFNKFSFLAGLREETTFVRVKSDRAGADITKNYTDFFPTLHLNYEVSESSQLQASYSRRINRPWSRMLIPYKTLSDDRNTFSGNPDLNPSYTDSYELGFNMQKSKWGITPSVYFQRTNDPVQMVTLADSQGKLNSTPINLGHENRYGGELSYTYKPYKWWRIFGEFNFYQYENFGNFQGKDFGKNGFSWNTRLNTSITLPEIVNFQLQGNYMAPRKNGQNKMKEMFGMNIGVSKDVLKGKGTLLFNIQDVFNSRKRKVETFGEDFYRYSEMQWRPRQFTLTFTYRFGNDKQKNDKKNRQRNDQQDLEMGEMTM